MITGIENALLALALDKLRQLMTPILWNLPPRASGRQDKQMNLVQFCFPGVHVSCGGGSEDGLIKKDQKVTSRLWPTPRLPGW